jgi:hypothetical protein
VLGLNGLVRVGARQAGAWDPANAEALFAHAAAAAAAAAAGDGGGAGVWGYELGNEPHFWQLNGWATNITAEQHAADWAVLRAAVAKVYAAAVPPVAPPRLLGPDVFVPCTRGSEGAAPHCDVSYVRQFVAAAPDVDVLTFHLYPLIGTPNVPTAPTAEWFYNYSWLDLTATAAAQVTAAAKGAGGAPSSAAPLPVWAGEGSPDWKVEGAFGGNLTFEFGVADMAASLARGGVAVFARQCLTSLVGRGFVTPGYWVSVLWKQLVGAAVFDATSSDPALRAYAHGTAAGMARGADARTVLLMNTAGSARNVSVTAATAAAGDQERHGSCATQLEYHVTAGPNLTDAHSGRVLAGVLVNGRQPAFVDGAGGSELPDFGAAVAPCGSGVVLAPRSFAFVVLEHDA